MLVALATVSVAISSPGPSDSPRVFHVTFHDLLSKVFMLSTE